MRFALADFCVIVLTPAMKLAVVRSEWFNSCTAPRTSTLSPYDLPRLAINKLSVVTEDGQTRHVDASEEHRFRLTNRRQPARGPGEEDCTGRHGSNRTAQGK